VTSIPTKGLPRSLTIGGGEVQSTEAILSGEYENTHEKRSGQILWIRGLTRLQTQVGYYLFSAFKKQRHTVWNFLLPFFFECLHLFLLFVKVTL
jgi:hypothetical protein